MDNDEKKTKYLAMAQEILDKGDYIAQVIIASLIEEAGYLPNGGDCWKYEGRRWITGTFDN